MKEGNGCIYSEQNVDYLYQNTIVEKFYTEKTYNENVINLYIFDDYEDMIGYTCYPVLNINHILLPKNTLLTPLLSTKWDASSGYSTRLKNR
ncbi:MAG: hypothetical protein QMB24_00365 [Spirosomataceae bacterium]